MRNTNHESPHFAFFPQDPNIFSYIVPNIIPQKYYLKFSFPAISQANEIKFNASAKKKTNRD